MARTPQADKVPLPPSRFRDPLSVFYMSPRLRRERLRRQKDDWGGPFAVELPLVVLRLGWGVLKIIAYLGVVAGRTVALPFRSTTRAPR